MECVVNVIESWTMMMVVVQAAENVVSVVYSESRLSK